jgi:hypothetical protein
VRNIGKRYHIHSRSGLAPILPYILNVRMAANIRTGSAWSGPVSDQRRRPAP